MKIVVLAGGLSPERDVSLSSGSQIANSLMESGNDVFLLDVYEGIDTKPDDFSNLFMHSKANKKYEFKIPDTEPDLEEIKKRTITEKNLLVHMFWKFVVMQISYL